MSIKSSCRFRVVSRNVKGMDNRMWMVILTINRGGQKMVKSKSIHRWENYSLPIKRRRFPPCYNQLYRWSNSPNPSIAIGKKDKWCSSCIAPKLRDEIPRPCYASGKVSLQDIHTPSVELAWKWESNRIETLLGKYLWIRFKFSSDLLRCYKYSLQQVHSHVQEARPALSADCPFITNTGIESHIFVIIFHGFCLRTKQWNLPSEYGPSMNLRDSF